MTLQPICQYPQNPHYFLFRGQPTILITSAEHYGSVINLDFDYLPYLDVLTGYGLNYTRIYAGAYLEPEHYFIQDNPLGPRIGRHCLPWGRSSVPGYPLGGNLFDLNQWNPAYFSRLKDFVFQAGKRGIVVEVCMFNAMYPDTWIKMPLYHANNIQGVGKCECKDFQTVKDQILLAYQKAYVCKITKELNDFDNVILEICDEPGIHATQPDDYTPWLTSLAAVIVETEKGLPNRHLIAQQICGTLGGAGDLSNDPNVAVIVGQYIGSTDGAQFGGMQLLDANYGYKKPIELNETAYYPIWYEGDRLGASRVEAWEFIIGGGAGFNHLNGLFSTFNSAAKDSSNEPVLQTLHNLKIFMERFNFIRMRRDTTFIEASPSEGTFVRGISEPGKQYAVYIHHSRNMNVKYVVQPGDYQDSLQLSIWAGSYKVEWIDPTTGSTIHQERFLHSGGSRIFATPHYSIDIALSIMTVE
jgi:hypothetical protein